MILFAVLLTAAAWWFFHEDPETEVRKAHQKLSLLLSKAEGQTTGAVLLDAHRLNGLFAESCKVTDDAATAVRDYTPDEMVSTILQVQSLFHSVNLTFHDLAVEFPEADMALVDFTAVLIGRSKIEGEEDAAETRNVVSRLQRTDGDWLFSEFRLSKVLEEGANYP